MFRKHGWGLCFFCHLHSFVSWFLSYSIISHFCFFVSKKYRKHHWCLRYYLSCVYFVKSNLNSALGLYSSSLQYLCTFSKVKMDHHLSIMVLLLVWSENICHHCKQVIYTDSCPLSPFALCCVAGLYRLKGAYDATFDLEEMRKEKEEADREPRVSILSLVSLYIEKEAHLKSIIKTS